MNHDDWVESDRNLAQGCGTLLALLFVSACLLLFIVVGVIAVIKWAVP